MFDKDFYPTPEPLIQKMLNKINRRILGGVNGTSKLRILEPSAAFLNDLIAGIQE